MAHINLLPWREARREQRKREFVVQLVMAFILGLVVVIGWAVWMNRRIDNQNARNDYLKGQIKQVDAKIAKIKDLQEVRTQLLARKHIIEQLQSNRSQMVHLFDELVKTIPDSVRLTSMKQNGQQLSLAGVAQSNASVADYMTQLGSSPWMGTPELGKTVNHHNSSRMPYSFTLGVKLSKPTQKQIKAAEDKEAAADEQGTVTVSNPAPASSAAVPAAATSTVPSGMAGDKTASPTPSPVATGGANS